MKRLKRLGLLIIVTAFGAVFVLLMVKHDECNNAYNPRLCREYGGGYD